MIAPRRMRPFAALLLLLLVPGLLLPAGLWLQVCRCERPAPTVRTCCHATATATPGNARACCRHGAHREAPATPLPAAQPDDCGCTSVPLPDVAEPTTPSLPFVLPPVWLPTPAGSALTAAFGAATATPRLRPRLRAPPPPGIDRNLPLRL